MIMMSSDGGWEARVNHWLGVAQRFAEAQPLSLSVEVSARLTTYNILLAWSLDGLERFIDVAIPFEEPPSCLTMAGLAMHPDRFRNESLLTTHRLPGGDEFYKLLGEVFAIVNRWHEADLNETW